MGRHRRLPKMLPIYDESDRYHAIEERVIPRLEALSGDPGQLDRARRRFDRDEPPTYSTSTEEDYREFEPRAPSPDPQEVTATISAPLSETEYNSAISSMRSKWFADAGHRFTNEARLEDTRISSFIRSRQCNRDTKEYLIGQEGLERQVVISRHYIKKRWQRLGIWNSNWGIPERVYTKNENGVKIRKFPRASIPEDDFSYKTQICRLAFSNLPCMQDNDNPDLWTWAQLPQYSYDDPSHPVCRAVQLRKGLLRGEPTPLPQRDKLVNSDSNEEMEKFLSSRPFVLFELEKQEENQRKLRLTWSGKRLPDSLHDTEKSIMDIWKERGDWKEEWDTRDYNNNMVLGWEWPHESSASEVPDYTELNSRDDMDFTPSEIDALEAIDAGFFVPDPATQPEEFFSERHTPPIPFEDLIRGYRWVEPNTSSPDYSSSDHSSQDHSNQDHSNQDHSNQDHSNQDHSNQDHSNQDHSNQDQNESHGESTNRQQTQPRRTALVAAKNGSESFATVAPGRSKQSDEESATAQGQNIPQETRRSTDKAAPSRQPPPSRMKAKGGHGETIPASHKPSAPDSRGQGRRAKKGVPTIVDVAKPQGVKKRGRPRKVPVPSSSNTVPKKQVNARNQDSTISANAANDHAAFSKKDVQAAARDRRQLIREQNKTLTPNTTTRNRVSSVRKPTVSTMADAARPQGVKKRGRPRKAPAPSSLNTALKKEVKPVNQNLNMDINLAKDHTTSMEDSLVTARERRLLAREPNKALTPGTTTRGNQASSAGKPMGIVKRSRGHSKRH